MDSQDHIPGHHPHRGIFVSLVFAIILLVGIFFLFVYSVFLAPEPEIETSELEQAIEDSILNQIEEVKVEEIVEEVSPDLSKYEGRFTAFEPNFSYPTGWHIFGSTLASIQTGYVHTMYIDQNPITLFAGGIVFPVRSQSIDRSSADLGASSTYVEYFDSTHEDEFFTESSRITDNINSGTLTTITGEISGMVEAYVEYLIYEAETHSIIVSFTDIMPESEEDNEGWEIIKNSLDFSNIE